MGVNKKTHDMSIVHVADEIYHTIWFYNHQFDKFGPGVKSPILTFISNEIATWVVIIHPNS